MKGAEIVTVILTVSFSNLFLASRADYPSHWVQPDAWSRSNDAKNNHIFEKECSCPVCETCPAQSDVPEFTVAVTHAVAQVDNFASTLKTEGPIAGDAQKSSTKHSPSPSTENESNANEEHGHFLFKKLSNYLLDRKQMKWDKLQGQYYRKFHFIISVDQYNRLAQATSSQDIDSVLSEILFQSKTGTLEQIKENVLTILDQLRPFCNSRNMWFFVNVLGVVVLWFASRWYKFNFLFVILAFGLYLVFAAVYAECNRKNDIKKMVAMMEKHSTPDPCDIKNYGFVKSFFFSQSADCKEYLIKHYETAESCSIIEVYNQFVEIFIFNPFFTFIHKISDLIGSIYSVHGFFKFVATLIVTVYLLSHFGAVFITAFFKYNLNWIFSFIVGGKTHDKNTSNLSAPTVGHQDTTNKLIDLAAQQQQLLHTIINSEREYHNRRINFELTSRIEEIPIEPVTGAKENEITFEMNSVERNNTSIGINEGDREKYRLLTDPYCSDDQRKEALSALLSSRPYITICAKTKESQMLHLWFEIDNHYQILKQNYAIRKAKRLSTIAYELAVDLDGPIDLSRHGIIEILNLIYTKKTVYLDGKEIGELYLQLLCLTDIKTFEDEKSRGDTDYWSNSELFISQVEILSKCKMNMAVIKKRIDKIEKALRDAEQVDGERQSESADDVKTVRILETAQNILVNEGAFKMNFKCKSVQS